jgi:FkbM family methyltransferase
MNNEIRPNLIFDIGASEGNDSAFYLAKGFDVVAVEADPVICNSLTERFHNEISNKRFTLINKVANELPNEKIKFYRNSNEQGRSSIR